MGARVTVVNQIEEAFLKSPEGSICPYCGVKETRKGKEPKNAPKGDTNVVTQQPNLLISQQPWLETHLIRCRQKKVAYSAAQIIVANKHRYGLHDECGRCMILETREGLCLVENDARRYVVPANTLGIGCVASVLQVIESRDLNTEQLQEVIQHLMVKAKKTKIGTVYRRGMRVEFKHDKGFSIGRINRRHGLYGYIVEIEPEMNRVNVSHNEITQILE